MLKTALTAVTVTIFAVAPVLAFDKADNMGGKGGGKKMVGVGMAMGKDGEKGDGKGGKPDKSLGMRGMAMGKEGGDKGEGKGGKPDKSFGMRGLAMGKDGGDKGEGKGGGKKGVIAPIDNAAMRGQQGMSRNQIDRGMERGGAMDRGMEQEMDRNLDGLNR